MKKTTTSFVLLVLFNLFISPINAQTLNAGDIAIIGVHTDANDQFTWVSLTDIPAGEQIYFTDKGWNSSANSWFVNTEGHVLWTSPGGGLPCGTIVHITETSANTFSINSGAGTISFASGAWSQSAGDQVLAYQSTTGVEPASPSFIAGLHGDYNAGDYNATTTWNNGVSSINGSASQVPPGLTNTVNCVSLYPAPGPELDNNRYTGTLTGTSTVLLTLINNPSNWTVGNNAVIPIDPSQYPTPSVICSAPCTAPSIPTISASPSSICQGGTSTLTISGALNDATAWNIYTGSCGGTLIGTTSSGTFTTATLSGNTTFFVRGEGGCVTPSSCGSSSIAVNGLDDASFSYASSVFCLTALNPIPTVTGIAGGTYSGSAGLIINTATGEIDLSTTGVGGPFTITYTTIGTCPNTSMVSVSITTAPDASFNYTGTPYCATGTAMVTFSGGASAGVFSAVPAGLTINTTSGEIDLAGSTTGTYTVTNDITAAGGCAATIANSSITINATPVVNPTVLVGCDSLIYNGTMYYASVMVSDTVFLGSVNGCDSVTNQQITINNVDASVTNASPMLTANAIGATYQWIDCNAGNTAIAGETNQSFTATSNGDYAVEVTMSNCTNISACVNIAVIGIEEVLAAKFNVHPNPTTGNITIDLSKLDNATISIMNSVGKTVFQAANITQSKLEISLAEFSNGIYFVKVQYGDNFYTQKIVKQ